MALDLDAICHSLMLAEALPPGSGAPAILTPWQPSQTDYDLLAGHGLAHEPVIDLEEQRRLCQVLVDRDIRSSNGTGQLCSTFNAGNGT